MVGRLLRRIIPILIALLLPGGVLPAGAAVGQSPPVARLLVPQLTVYMDQLFPLDLLVTPSSGDMEIIGIPSIVPLPTLIQVFPGGRVAQKWHGAHNDVRHVVRYRFWARALQAGSHTLELKITLKLAERRIPISSSPLATDPFFIPAPKPLVAGRSASLDTVPLRLTVRPLPAGQQPAVFSGAVGQFALSVRDVVEEPASAGMTTVNLLIAGHGVLTPSMVPPAELSDCWGGALKVVHSRFDPDTGRSEMLCRQMIKMHSGCLPEWCYAWFDPLQGRFRQTTVRLPSEMLIFPSDRQRHGVLFPLAGGILLLLLLVGLLDLWRHEPLPPAATWRPGGEDDRSHRSAWRKAEPFLAAARLAAHQNDETTVARLVIQSLMTYFVGRLADQKSESWLKTVAAAGMSAEQLLSLGELIEASRLRLYGGPYATRPMGAGKETIVFSASECVAAAYDLLRLCGSLAL